MWHYNKDKKGDLDATSSSAKARLNKVRGPVRPPPGVDGSEPSSNNNDRNESSWSRGQDVADKYKQYNASEREKDLWDDVPAGDFEFGSLEGDSGGGGSGGFDLSDFAAAAEKFRSDTKNLGVDKADHPLERYDASTDETMEELRKGGANSGAGANEAPVVEEKKAAEPAPSSGAMRSKLLQVLCICSLFME